MRPKTLISLGFIVLVVAMGVASFYDNVLDPHDSGSAMPGMVMEEDGSAVATADPSQPIAPLDGEAGGESSSGSQVMPTSLTGLLMAHLVDGPQAITETEQLHGKGLGEGLDAAWIAHYGQGGEATVWLSRSAKEADAQTLMDRMSEKIQQGGSPFSNFQPIDKAGTQVIALDGMGQKHYYFRLGADLYWLAVVPDRSDAALGELLDGGKKEAAQ